MNKTELLKHQAAQDQAQIRNLQLRLARAVARAEKAEAELKAMGADQKPLLYIQFSNCGAHIRFWTKNMDRMQAQQAAFPEPEMAALYARPIPATPSALRRDAARVIAAWDGTVLQKSNDGRLQQEMEHLRELIGAEYTPQPVTVRATYPIPAEWIAAVTASRDQFKHYANLHRAKGTPDGDEKAWVNQHNADILTKLLERAK